MSSTWSHACWSLHIFEDIKAKGEGRQEDGVTGFLVLWLQLWQGGVIHQMKELSIQRHLPARRKRVLH